jgi:transposase
LLERLAICVSDDTILRRIKAAPAGPASAPIRNLGVDDWAWRKGQDYGTILVDLEQRRVIDLLANRSVNAFHAWLEQHPGIAVIARDRSGAYPEAASLGAPDAQQVADRFHLLLNLSAAVERAFEERSQQLLLPQRLNQKHRPTPAPQPPSRQRPSSSRNCNDENIALRAIK